MAKAKDISPISDMTYTEMRGELQTVRQQLRGRWREKLQVDRHSLDVAGEILRLQERKEELEQVIHGQSDQANGYKAPQQSEKIATDIPPMEQEASGIPPNHQTPPVTLKQVAEAIGGDVTRHKLRKMIDIGAYHAIQINRQTWIFDTRQLAERIVERLRR